MQFELKQPGWYVRSSVQDEWTVMHRGTIVNGLAFKGSALEAHQQAQAWLDKVTGVGKKVQRGRLARVENLK